jgi:hypothetical protein
LKQMQNQIYRILADRSGKPLRQIIRDTKRTDFYLDALRARDYGLIDEILGPIDAEQPDQSETAPAQPVVSQESPAPPSIAASERHADFSSR